MDSLQCRDAPVGSQPEKLPFHCQNNEGLNTAGYHTEKVRKIDPILID